MKLDTYNILFVGLGILFIVVLILVLLNPQLSGQPTTKDVCTCSQPLVVYIQNNTFINDTCSQRIESVIATATPTTKPTVNATDIDDGDNPPDPQPPVYPTAHPTVAPPPTTIPACEFPWWCD